MAMTTTTLSGAVVIDQNSITVASATGFAAGSIIKIDDEVMQVASNYSSGTAIPVLRGREGTAGRAHASGANVTVAPAADFQNPAPQTTARFLIAGRAREIRNYGAAGAITLPTPGNDMVAIIDGTGALAMTLANPTKEMDGDLLVVVANGKAAHTLTYTAGLGNGGGSFDVGTYSASLLTGCVLMACNGFWVLIGNGIAGATGATGGPLFA